MPNLCSIAGHIPQTLRHHNRGLDFTYCHHCGCDLIRADAGDWTEVPKGFRVVWREFDREGDAASVAERMVRIAPPPRRRGPRNPGPAPRRDPRGTPLRGAACLLGTLAGLRALLTGNDQIEDDAGHATEAGRQQVIRLPYRGG